MKYFRRVLGMDEFSEFTLSVKVALGIKLSMRGSQLKYLSG